VKVGNWERWKQALGMWKGEERWFGLEEVDCEDDVLDFEPSNDSLEQSALTVTSVETPISLGSSQSHSDHPIPSMQSLLQPQPDISLLSEGHFSHLSQSHVSELHSNPHSILSSPALSFSASFVDSLSSVGDLESVSEESEVSWEDDRHRLEVESFLRVLNETGR